MEPNRKAARQGGSKSQLIITSSNYQDIVNSESAINPDELQAKLAECLVRHRTVRRLVRCFGCGQPRSPVSMSSVAGICRFCVVTFREKGARAKSNFVQRAAANVGRFLRRCLG